MRKIIKKKKSHRPLRIWEVMSKPRRSEKPMACLGTLYLFIPKIRKGGYVPFFVTEKRWIFHTRKSVLVTGLKTWLWL